MPPFPDISYLISDPYIPYHPYANNSVATNIAGYYNEEVNSLISRIFSENNLETRKILFNDVRNIIHEEVPYIGLYFYNNIVFYNKKIRGNLEPLTWNKYNNIIEWYITE